MKNIDDILRALPHRHPFLFVDRVLQMESGKSIVAAKQVSISEPYFQGHFPQKPVMPGVLIVESLAQTCGLLMLLSRDDKERRDGDYMLLTGVDNCRFRRLVLPGDSLLLRADLVRKKHNIFRFHARATVDDKPVCETDLMMASQLSEK